MRDEMLVYSASGEWDFDRARAFIDEVAAACKEHGKSRVLANHLDVEVEGTVLAYERFLIGQRIAETLQGIRVAILFPADQINKFTESVAVAGGVDLLVTGDREAALEWLSRE